MVNINTNKFYIDWSAGIIQTFTSDGKSIPLIVLPIYVFISNFIMLNTLIAISCEYFVEQHSYRIDFSRKN